MLFRGFSFGMGGPGSLDFGCRAYVQVLNAEPEMSLVSLRETRPSILLGKGS